MDNKNIKEKNTLQKIFEIPVLGHIFSFVIILAVPAFATLFVGYIYNDGDQFFYYFFPPVLVVWCLFLLFRCKIKGAVLFIVIGIIRIIYVLLQ